MYSLLIIIIKKYIMTEEETDDLLGKYPGLDDIWNDVGRMTINGDSVIAELNEYMVSEEKQQQKQHLIDIMRGDE